MKSLARHLAAFSAAAALAFGAGPALADVKAGIQAWQAGDYARAVKEWRPLAEAGDVDAQFNIGQAYKLGRGVPTDFDAALAWFQKAAAKGHGQAQVNVGLLLYNGGKKKEALPWLKKAAEMDDPRAQYILGTEMFNGQIVGKDWATAYALMTRAASQGLPPAAQNLEAMEKIVPLAQRKQGIALAQKWGTPAASAPPPARSAATPARSQPPARAVAAATPPRAAQSPAAAGKWRVQLGAFGSAANAQRHWNAVRAKAGSLSALQPAFVPAGGVTRLQAGPLASRAAADKACAAARAAGSACFPVAP